MDQHTDFADRPENERARIGANHPPDLDLENLIDLDQLRAALRLSYPDLQKRRDELCAAIERWTKQHGEPPVIADEIDAGVTADFLKLQLAPFGGKQGEAERTRQKIKGPLLVACEEVDEQFNNRLRGPVLLGMKLMQDAGTAFVLRREAEERERRRRAAAEAAAEAKRLAEEAEAGRVSDDAAVEAEERALHVAASVDQVKEAGRVRGDFGSTVSGRSTWKVRVTDIKKLAGAVARGDLATDWIVLNETVANAMVRGKSGKRQKDLPTDCGIEIHEERVAR